MENKDMSEGLGQDGLRRRIVGRACREGDILQRDIVKRLRSSLWHSDHGVGPGVREVGLRPKIPRLRESSSENRSLVEKLLFGDSTKEFRIFKCSVDWRSSCLQLCWVKWLSWSGSSDMTRIWATSPIPSKIVFTDYFTVLWTIFSCTAFYQFCQDV